MLGPPISMNELRDRARSHFEGKSGPGLIVVDYLQRMARATRDTVGVKELREAVTFLTERLRSLACELDCTVLAVASMNRQSGYGKNGDTSALSAAKESGDIEYTADVIMALVEDSSNKRTTASWLKPRVLRIDKNRLGETTTIDLDWYADRQQFSETDKEGR
jgi:replicative DNA helicase